jgi:SPW repeat
VGKAIHRNLIVARAAVTWNNVIVGIVVALLALIRTSAPQQAGWSWANVVLGIWLIVSPYHRRARCVGKCQHKGVLDSVSQPKSARSPVSVASISTRLRRSREDGLGFYGPDFVAFDGVC